MVSCQLVQVSVEVVPVHAPLHLYTAAATGKPAGQYHATPLPTDTSWPVLTTFLGRSIVP